MTLKFDVFILFSFVLTNSVHCYSMDDARKLLADKKLKYEKNFRPLVNQSRPLEIYIGLELVSIQDFDEVKEQLTIAGIITVYWIDEYMTWDPNDYGGLDQLVIESNNVWTPNLVLVNNVNKLEKIGDAWQIIRFSPNGFAHYFPGDVFSATCRVDVTYYPLDRHKCNFAFSPWAQSDSEIIFKPVSDHVLTSYFSENGAWTFYNSSIQYIPKSSYIDFIFNLERKPRFVLVNVIIPIIFMAFLNTMIFAIPVESGERISYSITVLLAIAVFLTLVGDNLPKTSSPMSVFGYYLLVVLIISIGITLLTILNVRLYYKDEGESVPGWIAKFVRCFKCSCKNKTNKRKRILSKYETEYKDGNGGQRIAKQETDIGKSNRNFTPENDYYVFAEKIPRSMINGRVPYQISTFSNTDVISSSMEVKTENKLKVTWKDVSSACDKFFFLLSFMIISVATIIFFVFITTYSKHG